MYADTRQLTLDLVAIPSVNGSSGESAVVEYLYERLKRHRAYREGRLRLFVIPAMDDPLSRPVLIAHAPKRRNAAHTAREVKPNITGNDRGAVLLFGHVDTVGTADFGPLEPLAFQPLALTERIQSGVLGPVAQQRASSGQWLYGRGVLDMKSGLAAALTAFEALVERGEDRDLFFSATPDEESGGLGAKTLAAWLHNYLASERIAIRAAMNTDYTTYYPGDKGARHIYLGSIGKLLPAAYVRGIPSHAAEPENGIDPNFLLAAITKKVVYSPTLRDRHGDEVCPYPVCLYQRDDKTAYDVQTAVSATAYYNLFHMNRSPGEQLELFTDTVRQAIEHAQDTHASCLSTDIPVMTFSELSSELPENMRREVWTFAQSLTIHQDLRERCRMVVERLLAISGRAGACVVTYFANGLIPRVDSGARLEAPLRATLEAFGRIHRETFRIHRYFPYISDLSFLTTSPDADDAIYRSNFPFMFMQSEPPSLEIPTLMVGTYGFGAHQPDECVDVKYTFERLPELLRTLAQTL